MTMADRERECLESYNRVASIVERRVRDLCVNMELDAPSILIVSESTSEMLNDYELLKIHLKWREDASRCSLDRILTVSEILASRDPVSMIERHISEMRQQIIKSHLSNKSQ